MSYQVHGIEIEIDLQRNFITPDWDKVIDFYPTWAAKMKERGDEPWMLQSYMIGFARALERAGVRGRTSKQWMERYFEHFGMGHLAAALDRFIAAGVA